MAEHNKTVHNDKTPVQTYIKTKKDKKLTPTPTRRTRSATRKFENWRMGQNIKKFMNCMSPKKNDSNKRKTKDRYHEGDDSLISSQTPGKKLLSSTGKLSRKVPDTGFDSPVDSSTAMDLSARLNIASRQQSLHEAFRSAEDNVARNEGELPSYSDAMRKKLEDQQQLSRELLQQNEMLNEKLEKCQEEIDRIKDEAATKDKKHEEEIAKLKKEVERLNVINNATKDIRDKVS